jgi:hypothetical protein
MATMVVPSISVREAVLQAVRNHECRPLDLLTSLAHQGFDDADIKQALSELIHDGKLELTTNRMLKFASEAAA